MTDSEKKLLDNVLDGLDRLFDSESSTPDLQALIFATSKALSNTKYFAILESTANSLEMVLRSRLNAADERIEALKVTDELRIFLVGILDF